MQQEAAVLASLAEGTVGFAGADLAALAAAAAIQAGRRSLGSDAGLHGRPSAEAVQVGISFSA